MPPAEYQAAIAACQDCAVKADACSTLCVIEHEDAERMAALYECSLLARDVARICYLAVSFLTTKSRFAEDLLHVVASCCDDCAHECEPHAEVEHVALCAEACRRCAAECRVLLSRGEA